MFGMFIGERSLPGSVDTELLEKRPTPHSMAIETGNVEPFEPHTPLATSSDATVRAKLQFPYDSTLTYRGACAQLCESWCCHIVPVLVLKSDCMLAVHVSLRTLCHSFIMLMLFSPFAEPFVARAVLQRRGQPPRPAAGWRQGPQDVSPTAATAATTPCPTTIFSTVC